MIIDGISHQPTYQSNTYILCTSLQYNSLKPDSLKIKQQVWFSEDFLRSKASRGHFTTISLVSGSNAISYSTTTLHVKLKKESHLNVSTLISTNVNVTIFCWGCFRGLEGSTELCYLSCFCTSFSSFCFSSWEVSCSVEFLESSESLNTIDKR